MYPKSSGGGPDPSERGADDRRASPAHSTSGCHASSGPGAATAVVEDIRPLVGGRSSLTYLVRLQQAAPIVVKMAPPGLATHPQSGRAATGAGPGRDRAQWSCPGRGGVLHRCRRRRPTCRPCTRWSSSTASRSSRFSMTVRSCLPRRSSTLRQLHAARALAGLHSIAPDSVGLDDEPEVTLPEEVERWVRIFETVSEDLRPGYQMPAEALLATLPAPVPTTVVHGEYRLGNLLARGGEVLAIIDWELWTREDPRVDLSWFLSYVDADEQPSAIRGTPEGMPSRAPSCWRPTRKRSVRRLPISTGSTPTPASRWPPSPRW